MTVKEELYKKFEAVPTRPGRGGTYSYIKWQDVADRMNTIFGTQWSSQVVYQDVVNSNVVVRVRVTISSTEPVDSYHQEGFGGASMDDRQEAGNPFKSAYSKALKDACKKWGIGLYIDEEEEQSSMEPTKVPLMNIPIVPVETTPSIQTEAPIPPSHTTGNNLAKDTVKQPVMMTPPIPPMAGSGTKPIESGGMAIANTTISDVQKAALQSILNIQGVEYEELVKGAFTTKGTTVPEKTPTIDNLSYQEAVMVIKYGNDNFRKH